MNRNWLGGIHGCFRTLQADKIWDPMKCSWFCGLWLVRWSFRAPTRRFILKFGQQPGNSLMQFSVSLFVALHSVLPVVNSGETVCLMVWLEISTSMWTGLFKRLTKGIDSCRFSRSCCCYCPCWSWISHLHYSFQYHCCCHEMAVSPVFTGGNGFCKIPKIPNGWHVDFIFSVLTVVACCLSVLPCNSSGACEAHSSNCLTRWLTINLFNSAILSMRLVNQFHHVQGRFSLLWFVQNSRE